MQSRFLVYLLLPLLLILTIYPSSILAPPPYPIWPDGPFTIAREEFNHNPIFDPHNYASLTDWFTAYGRILEIGAASTRRCLDAYAEFDDKTACFSLWSTEFDAITGINYFGFLFCPMATAWLLWQWLMGGIIFLADLFDFYPYDDDDDDEERRDLVSKGGKFSVDEEEALLANQLIHHDPAKCMQAMLALRPSQSPFFYAGGGMY